MSRRTLPLVRTDFGRLVAATEPHVYHCNHYNYWLQKTLLLVEDLQMEDVMVDAAAAMAFSSVSAAVGTLGATGAKERLEIAGAIFTEYGFGRIDWLKISIGGGLIALPTSHYGQLFAHSKEGDDFARAQNIFDRGFVAGALAAAYGLHAGSYESEVVGCHSLGHPVGKVRLKRREPPEDFPRSCHEGEGSQRVPPAPVCQGNVDEPGILKALSGLDLSGNEEGFIPRFGVMLTAHWAGFYNHISYRYLHKMMATGMVESAELLLVDAGHHCAFNTFGGVMQSPEWDAVVKPMCQTREDWVRGMVACINVLGWGTWRVKECSPDRLVLNIWDDYESRGYLGMHGRSERPIAYLAQGGAAGIMNLIYTGDIRERPLLDAAFYAKIFDAQDSFVASQVHCMAQGFAETEIVVKRR